MLLAEPSPREPRANLGLSEDVECEGSMIPIRDVVAVVWRVSNLDALLVELIDPVTSPIHEPAEGLPLCRPPRVRRHFRVFIRALDLVGQLEERQVVKRAKTKNVAKTPPPVSMEAYLAVVQD